MANPYLLPSVSADFLGHEDSQLSLFPDLPVRPVATQRVLHLEKRRFTYINHLQCALVKNHIGVAEGWSRSGDSFMLREQPRADQTRALIFLIAICDRLNWNFVLGALAGKLSESTNLFDPESISALSLTEFRQSFGSYSRDDGAIKFSQKLRMLKAVARHMLKTDPITQLLRSRSVQGETGAQSIILQMPAYSEDPLRKKCNTLLHEIVRRDLIKLSDPETIAPAIDYHIMRLYLRTGRVEINDAVLSQRLIRRGRVRIERITEIRQAVAAAMRYTAWLNGLTVSSLNDLEWLFARKACRRDGVWCANGTGCPLEAVCPSAHLSPNRMITEPESRHGHY